MSNPYFEKISIENYRLCKNTQFKPNRYLTTLIGPNGSGKTTILRGIFLLKQLTRETNVGFRDKVDDDEIQPTRITVWINLDGKSVQHIIDLKINTDENNDDEIIISRQLWNMKDFNGTGKSFKMPLSMSDDYDKYSNFFSQNNSNINLFKQITSNIDVNMLRQDTVMQAIKQVSGFYKQITYYSASQFTNPSNCPVSFEVDDKMQPIRSPRFLSRRSDGHERWLFDMFTEDKEHSKEFAQFEDIVGPNGIGLVDRIEFQNVETSSLNVSVKIGGSIKKVNKVRFMVIPKFYIGRSVLSPTQLSEGTFKTLAMVFYLMTGKSRVVLLEEPEVCIHQGLLSSLIELIKQYSREKQVFISTHSDHILDELDHDHVFVVFSDKSEGISATPLAKWMPKEDVGALKTFLANEGSLGEYWRSGGFDDTSKN